MFKKNIVISAVNLVEAGTLAILKDCLKFLSVLAEQQEYRIIAIVYKKEIADFPNIEYIETQWPKKRWVNRLWYEYVEMKKISKRLAPVELWFSLHDTSPSVIAKNRAVYCHNAFSFYKWKLSDFIFAPKIALFALFTKYIYKTNIHDNDYLVVQQEWFRQAMSQMFGVNPEKIIVAPPSSPKKLEGRPLPDILTTQDFSFIFAASPNSHKNFEVICRAVEIIHHQHHLRNFQVYITLKGDENAYARWLYKKWGKEKGLNFIGFLDKETLFAFYLHSSCMIFPSKIETWGLPISEFSVLNKPMLLADLPYAHETASGSHKVAFFNPNKPEELAIKMLHLIQGNDSDTRSIAKKTLKPPVARDWNEVFKILLEKKNIHQ
ncbi:glycosyltransferase [Elizabethkingia argentiflava]|uniref:Glycosyltransferase n=1 Tax=Elizabethkingia argenteiflava TaxID=2681556 RepID=A0A845PSY6_9FLAO|nr:glycosyltransferase family 1 protein [Elizabethkingia argenteiflava]NAW51342.1 glycosyltransferase [Elizabethkingia argenteiflava]